MATWFSVRVCYDSQNEKGMMVKTKEVYLADALSFTEAEARIIGEVTPYAESGLMVTAMKIEDIEEIFNDDSIDGRWYKVKVMFKTVDEKSGKEKKESHSFLVFGYSTEDATKRLHERMKGTMVDYEVHTVSETQYVDVFFYEEGKVTDETSKAREGATNV